MTPFDEKQRLRRPLFGSFWSQKEQSLALKKAGVQLEHQRESGAMFKLKITLPVQLMTARIPHRHDVLWLSPFGMLL